ncbi:hypothetical protein EJ04DRAFT_3618 [Polyplosphaeria fusca]|uniref:EGF-like domain-containing protein n=1 Tax=Polyplosphaeria fusca TaxID=682080 RepID=A0A9P4R9D6_9PLEO|nr:hypothetical protein EJ04DRAFT_3618 [Polyplosphaeria fusca]
MSYDPRLAGRPYGAPDEDDGARKGSVRAARERMQASQTQGQRPDRSRIVGLPQRPNQLVSQFSSQNRPHQPQNLTPPDSRGKTNAFSPTPEWPLPNEAEDEPDYGPDPYSIPLQRGPPPQRPPRPSSDELPIQQTSTSPRDYRSSSYSDDMFSPVSATASSRPLTTSSAASEASSLGSIPDFPVPQLPMPAIQSTPRRQPSLGPPPSSRRGPSSYYTQNSYVSPIVEESETRSDITRSHHGSFASSNVIPYNTDDYYMRDDGLRSDDDETVASDNGRDSRGSDHDDKSGLVQPALVRQASLGRRTKPSIMTIKSVEPLPTKRKPVPDATGPGAASAMGIGAATLAAREAITAPRGGQLGNGTGLLDPSGSSSESLSSFKNEKSKLAVRSLDPEKGELDSPVHPLQQSARQNSLADRVGKRRPPRIDVDAVREAEARGSLTSLPELIRRATRLAANLDRGRTASRLGLDFWESGAPEKGKFDARRSGSLSDMLAAFPPPGDATPTGDRTPNRNVSKWPSRDRFGGRDSASSSRRSKRRRRCCGMPMWTFVTLLVVLLFLVAAAVVIPVVLIVIPKMRDNNASSAPQNTGNNNNNNNNNPSSNPTDNPNNNPPSSAPTAPGQSSQCDGIISCQNGGVAIFQADRTCNCVCINGFTGSTCGTEGDAGCTTTNVAGTANNATIGSGIPRLLSSARNNFSIPLDPSGLLSVFSSLSLSCTSENALITFNGLSSRMVHSHYLPRLVDPQVIPSRTLPSLDEGTRDLRKRQAVGEPGEANAEANATPTETTSPAPSVTQPVSSNPTAIDFARIGVLLALQESRKLDTAANAQEALQSFLTNDRDGRNNNGDDVDLGPLKINLVELSMTFQNGTTLQARPSSSTTD